MRKIVLLTIVLMTLIIGFISGCIGGYGPSGSDVEGCLTVIIIGVVALIIIVAYLLGHKKTNVNVTTSASPPVIIREEKSPPVFIQEEQKEIKKRDRRCPECGRVIPDDAKLCPYCGKKFRNYFTDEQTNDVEILDSPEEKNDEERIVERSKNTADEVEIVEHSKDDEVEIVEPSKDIIEQKQLIKRPKYCPECGQKLEDDVSFCTNCGNKLDGE